jgi:superfamily II DNA or RNA helicase
MTPPVDLWLDVTADRQTFGARREANGLFDEFGDALPAGLPGASAGLTDRRHGANTTPGRHRQSPPPEPWRIFLANVAAPSAAAFPSGKALATGELIYVFDPGSSARAGGVVIEALTRTRKKSGDWGKPRPLSLARRDIPTLPEASDRNLLSAVCGADPTYGVVAGYDYTYAGAALVPANFVLNPTLQRELLPKFCETGRLYLRNPVQPDVAGEGPLVAIDWDIEPAAFRLSIRREHDTFVISGEVLRAGAPRPLTDAVFLTASVILWAPIHSTMAPRFAMFDPGGGERGLPQLVTSGTVAVPASEGAMLSELLVTAQIARVECPDELRVDVMDAPPQPVLRLSREHHPRSPYVAGRLEATLSFAYGGTEALGGTASPVIFDRKTRSAWRRDLGAEREAAARLHALGVRRLDDWQAESRRLSVPANALPTVVRVLVDEGWRVEADGRLYRRSGHASLNVRSGIDWFDVHGSVDFDGVTASLPELLAAARRGDRVVTLDDGTLGMLPEDWLDRYGRVMAMGTATGDAVRFTKAQGALLDAWLESQPEVTVDEAFTVARQQLAHFRGIDAVSPPKTFAGTLRDYQREALGWFAFLRQFGFGGCLADEMGLGKTIMVLAALDARRTERRKDGPPARASLVVVPRSLVFNWQREAARFTPHLRVLDFTHGKRRDVIDEIGNVDLVLTTYGTLRRDVGDLKSLEFDYVILDEAQTVKNARTNAAKAVRLLQARHRLALSGTPVENHLGELWSLFDFLNPGMLGAVSVFAGASAGGRSASEETLTLLRRALRPFILRRTKEQVARELPSRTEQTLYCDLEPAQRSLYDGLRNHYRARLLDRVERVGLGRAKLQILEALLRLRQAACHPALVADGRDDTVSAKFDLLLPRLQELAEEGRQTLVFSQFTTLLALLRLRLDEMNIAYEYLDGKTRDRQTRVDRFQEGSCPVFLISLKAGGVGLNLTAAEYVFLLDPWWNPAIEAQAIDRTHRIGQTRPVFAYRLIARDTVEEKVLELQASKRALADAIIRADEGVLRELRREDLELLLS